MAMNEEYLALMRNKTWILAQPDPKRMWYEINGLLNYMMVLFIGTMQDL